MQSAVNRLLHSNLFFWEDALVFLHIRFCASRKNNIKRERL